MAHLEDHISKAGFHALHLALPLQHLTKLALHRSQSLDHLHHFSQ
jgi:hypothetical protein